MKTNLHDDPRLTAYALGEIPTRHHVELAAIEARLANNPALQQEVHQIRAVSSDLEQALIADLARTPTLTAAQQQTILLASRNKPWRSLLGWGLFTSTAAAAITFIIAPVIFPTRTAPAVGAPANVAITTITPPITSTHPLSVDGHSITIAVEEPKTFPLELVPTDPGINATNEPLTSETFADNVAREIVREESVTQTESFTQLSTDQAGSAGMFGSRSGGTRRMSEKNSPKNSDSESGSTGSFMAIGAGGGARVEVQRPGFRDIADQQAPRLSPVTPAGETYMQRAFRAAMGNLTPWELARTLAWSKMDCA
jgi:hypothetical protein